MKKQPKQEEQTEEEKELQHLEDVTRDYSEQQRREDDEAERDNEEPSWNLN